MLQELGELKRTTTTDLASGAPAQDFPYLWIDAICVNQDDMDERAAYVLRMRDIYHDAKAVIVWLGPHTESVRDLENRFLTLQAGFHKKLPDLPESDGELSEEVAAYLKQLVADFWSEDIIKEWEAVIAFFKLNWWQRVWTVQEMVVAKQVYFLQGMLVMAMWLVHFLIRTVEKHLEFLQDPAYRRTDVDALMHAVHASASQWHCTLAMMGRDDEDKLQLLDVLDMFRSRKCTDPR
jgi:Heterokaryon incompatibility protein (HET)